MNTTTLPPGLSNAALMARRAAALPRGVGQAHPGFAGRARNAEIWDVDGRRYIDFVAGIAVVNTGHRHPRVIAAAQRQIPEFTHTCFQVVAYEGYVRLCERLNALAPGDATKKTMLINSGAEAVENAVKIARAHTGRPGVIAFNGAFHGRTLLTLGLTGKIDPYKLGVGPFPSEIFHAPFPCAQHGISVDDAIDGLEKLFKNDIEPNRVAAFIVEPVQGEGGYYPAPIEFMQRLRELADRHGIVLIADEIQTGIARTGKLFAMEHYGVAADLTTLAKGLGGGFPIGAIWVRDAHADLYQPGNHGSTFGGGALACAAALAVLDIMERDDLLTRVRRQSETWHAALRQLAVDFPKQVSGMRGQGYLVGVQLTSEAPPYVAALRAQGLLAVMAGGNMIRLLPPLNATAEELQSAVDIFRTVLAAKA